MPQPLLGAPTKYDLVLWDAQASYRRLPPGVCLLCCGLGFAILRCRKCQGTGEWQRLPLREMRPGDRPPQKQLCLGCNGTGWLPSTCIRCRGSRKHSRLNAEQRHRIKKTLFGSSPD